jgi:transcriptional regulator with XRE-family HTH domain
MSMAEWIDRGFAVRLGLLLRETREARGQAREALSDQGSLSPQELEALELGTVPLDDELIGEVAALYGADLGALVEPRRAIEIDILGWISMGSARARFDPLDDTSLLTAYLSLVRQVRRQQREPVVALRRDDIEVLAGFLCLPGERVVEQLATLMGVTQQRRRTMVAMFAAGAAVIGLATASATVALGAGPLATSAVAAQMAVPLGVATAAVESPPAAAEPPSGVELPPPAPSDRSIDGVDLPAPLAPAARSSAIAAVPATAPPLPPPSVREVALSVPAPPTAGDPPVPVAEPEPGRVVAVGLPPVPPFPTLDGDRVVAVGLPPVPPVLDPPTDEPAP